MKKRFLVLLTVVLVMLCFVLVSCVIDGDSDSEKNSETVESSSETGEKKTESSEEITDESTGNFDIDVETFEPTSGLISSLKGELESTRFMDTPPDTRIVRMMSYMVFGGTQSMVVKIDPDEDYYVCCYYNSDHDEAEELYCCLDEYTWVGYYSENDILETYRGKALIAAFQVNKTEKCENIFDATLDVPYVEQYSWFRPTFENGKNVTDGYVSDNIEVLLYGRPFSTANELYYDAMLGCSIPCVEFEGKVYVSIYIGAEEDAYEAKIEEVLREELGGYYDALKDIVITDKYTEVSYWGYTVKYALIDIEDFVDYLLDLGCGKDQHPDSMPKELKKELIAYLKEVNVEYELPDTSFEDKINEIISKKQSLSVKTDPDDYYFVCGYYSDIHSSERIDYCCVDQYIWIPYTKAEFIKETFYDEALMVTFQVNKTTGKILPGANSSSAEVFRLYYPELERGINTKDGLVCDDSFLYIDYDEASEVQYICPEHMLFEYCSIPLIELDGKDYVVGGTYRQNSVETLESARENALKYYLGEHYDGLKDIVITDKYSVSDEYYILFELDEFAAYLQE